MVAGSFESVRHNNDDDEVTDVHSLPDSQQHSSAPLTTWQYPGTQGGC